MLADELDYVLGVDTHRDEHVMSVVTAPAGALVAGAAAPANAHGYRELLRVAAKHAPGRRAWAIEGTWAEAGISAKRISVWAGHRSVAFTLDRYAGVFEEREQSEMAKLDAFLELADSEARGRQLRDSCGTVRVRFRRSIAVHSGA
jgi:hypothetical protein